ncbi:hypothetical protein BB558_002309 [Smittium angustum]|uniref:Uncharacterized protein n=1 Tax=Smittium angustum TaxID=133377 RepID=A0A2U1J997_SMIAN|nr:hypothetical protein BB558_002309 [Smittium angustum]
MDPLYRSLAGIPKLLNIQISQPKTNWNYKEISALTIPNPSVLSDFSINARTLLSLNRQNIFAIGDLDTKSSPSPYISNTFKLTLGSINKISSTKSEFSSIIQSISSSENSFAFPVNRINIADIPILDFLPKVDRKLILNKTFNKGFQEGGNNEWNSNCWINLIKLNIFPKIKGLIFLYVNNGIVTEKILSRFIPDNYGNCKFCGISEDKVISSIHAIGLESSGNQ